MGVRLDALLDTLLAGDEQPVDWWHNKSCADVRALAKAKLVDVSSGSR